MDHEEVARTARLYQIAPDEILDRFEDAMDYEDVVLASAIRDEFLSQSDAPQATIKLAKDDPAYLEEDPEPGDMCFLSTCNRHVRLLAVSEDRKKAVIKDQVGCGVVDYDALRRVR